MENKEVYIDGVDVSGCAHKKNDACMAITDLSGDFCYYCDDEIMKDCYYKNWQRKEQECEILKDEYKILEYNLDSRTRYFEDVIDRYKQTLTEIKEIAELLAPMTNEYDNCYNKDRCSKREAKEDCQYLKVVQILQKISEVEE